MPVYEIPEAVIFPPVEEAEASGLLGIGGDLRPQRLLLAYASGIFPWYDDSTPILWFSPDPRTILLPGQLHLGRSARRALGRMPWRLAMDTAFPSVVRGCAGMSRPDQEGTWITADMIAAYERLHELGFAHSVETWDGERLVGGVYGVSLGRAFFGESMFSLEPGASRPAIVALVRQIERWGFSFLDCQMQSPHLARLGAREIPRPEFLALLAEALQVPTRRGRWRLDRDLDLLAGGGAA
jgi:leucyl/phenylalanyl-tRNA--protein transferase